MPVSGLDALMAVPPLRRVLSLERQRRWWSNRVDEGLLRECLCEPMVPRRQPVEEVEFLALDFETTGMDPRSHDIVSIGYTVIRQEAVSLADNAHTVLYQHAAIPESSVVVHGLTDDVVAAGSPVEQILPVLLQSLKGKVLVAHHAAIECGFLSRVCQRLYGGPWCGQVVDTMALERRRLTLLGTVPAPGGLRLAALRTQYGLPRYRAHDALTDAIACAELLLAQMAYRKSARPLLLQDLL